MKIAERAERRVAANYVEQWEALRVLRALAEALVSSGITAESANSTTSKLFGPAPPIAEC